MFTLNEKTYRNLQEQVLKNKEDIAYHYSIDRVLADFGIRVIGRVDTPEEIASQPIPAGGYQYGDAYAVGALNSVYDYYIYTRPFEGETENQWFNIGALQIEGPVGPQGVSITNAIVNEEYQLVLTYSDGRVVTLPRSLRGADGATPSVTLTSNNEGVTIKVYDGAGQLQQSALVRNGVDGQSIQGEPGPAGPIVQLQGIITSMSDLDGIDPTTLPPNYAYLLEQNGNRYIIGIVADQWTNLGIFAGGTLVTKEGVIQNEWDADTKLDKLTSTGSYKLYGINASGNEWNPILRQIPQTTNASYKYQPVMYDVTDNAYTNNGLIRISETPLERYHTASKAYVDNAFKVYQHNQHLTLTYDNEVAHIYYTCYDGGVNPKGYMKTNGVTAILSGYVTSLGGNQRPILYGEVDTANSNISVVTFEDGIINNEVLDSWATDNISDTVTRII